MNPDQNKGLQFDKGGRFVNILLICVSILISSKLATSNARLDQMELGALANIYFPPLIGLGTILFYFLLVRAIELKRNISLLICSGINISVGVFYHYHF